MSLLLLPCLLWALQPAILPDQTWQEAAELATQGCNIAVVARDVPSPPHYLLRLQRYRIPQAVAADFIFPLSPGWRITSEYSLRMHPVLHRLLPHKGVDFSAPRETQVMAIRDGNVEAAGYSPTAGFYVLLRHADGWSSRYMHLQQTDVSVGTSVKQGQVIALSGATGRVTGPHLHLEVQYHGQYVDPLQVIRQKAVATFQPTLPASDPLPRIVLVSGSGDGLRIGIKIGKKTRFFKPGERVGRNYKAVLRNGRYQLATITSAPAPAG